jgi:hypothetical protein
LLPILWPHFTGLGFVTFRCRQLPREASAAW